MPSIAEALAAAPRRWRMPPLPADVDSARAAGVDVALAFAIESARTGAAPGARELFLESLAQLIGRALDPASGDAAFQALVVRTNEPLVREYVALQARAAQDSRTVRRLVDAVAHPARSAPGPLIELHALARDGRWIELRARAAGTIDALESNPALERLAGAQALQDTEPVARYRALASAQGPLAGSSEAARSGRDSARAGDAAEAETVAALQEIARELGLVVARGLTMPVGFPGEAHKAKDEWDVALLQPRADGAHVVLLGEVKASPAAAPGDYPRLYRGLLRFAQADAKVAYEFMSADGPVTISGASLRALAPVGRALPVQVVYFCTSAVGPVPAPLSAASKAVLLGEAGSVAFARERDPRLLEPVWEALPREPRLRATLHQDDTARRACEAMLHPHDLLMALRG